MELLIDFGSTFTKLVLVDLEEERIVGTSWGPTTIDKGIMAGLKQALDRLACKLGKLPPLQHKIACSSAAGGLKMVAIGLVPKLTGEAAKRAALGAGAKVVRVKSFRLNPEDVKDLVNIRPEITLLVGGIDGGDSETILSNAKVLAASKLDTTVIVAGNKEVSHEVTEILVRAGIDAQRTENVMPNIGELNIEPAKNLIREIFMKKIIYAKGLDEAQEFVDGIVMPTPAAVMKGGELLTSGVEGEEGLGSTVIVDVGGATTDVHSFCWGKPVQQNIVLKGLPEPYAKRTVEGDIGVRYSADNLLDIVGVGGLKREAMLEDNSDEEIVQTVKRFSMDVHCLPANSFELKLDQGLAGVAVKEAVLRHAGVIRESYSPFDSVFVQYGKDLREVKNFIGTGGVIVKSADPAGILAGGLAGGDPQMLTPRHPQFFLDRDYLLFAVGLLSDLEPRRALRILKKSLVRI